MGVDSRIWAVPASLMIRLPLFRSRNIAQYFPTPLNARSCAPFQTAAEWWCFTSPRCSQSGFRSSVWAHRRRGWHVVRRKYRYWFSGGGIHNKCGVHYNDLLTKCNVCGHRTCYQSDLDDDVLPDKQWKFYVPKLGPMSVKQEGKVGPASILLSTTKEWQRGWMAPFLPWFFAIVHSRPSLRHCDKKSIAKCSHANVRSDFRNQTFVRERLAVDFLSQWRSEGREWTIAGQVRHSTPLSFPWYHQWHTSKAMALPPIRWKLS